MKINNTVSIFREFIVIEIGPFLGRGHVGVCTLFHSFAVTAWILHLNVFSVYPRDPMKDTYLQRGFLRRMIFLGSLHWLLPQGHNHF